MNLADRPYEVVVIAFVAILSHSLSLSLRMKKTRPPFTIAQFDGFNLPDAIKRLSPLANQRERERAALFRTASAPSDLIKGQTSN